MWLGAVGQSAISTGSAPINCRTLVATGSQAKAFAVSTALTGMVGSLTTIRAALPNSTNAIGPATAIHQPTTGSELVEGKLFCPPGGVLVVMNQVSTITINVSVGLTWEEVLV